MLKVGQRKNCICRNDTYIEIKLNRFNYKKSCASNMAKIDSSSKDK